MLKTKPLKQRDKAQSTSPPTAETSPQSTPLVTAATLAALSEFDFVSKYEISQLTGLAPATLKRYRLSGQLSEGIHWVKLNARVIRYNKRLMRDWMQNRDEPRLHQRAIEAYFNSLPSYERKNKKR